MNDLFAEVLDACNETAEPTFKSVFQACFILYLLLGQAVVLLAWRLAAPKAWSSSRLGQTLFALYLLLAQAGLLFAWSPLISAWLAADATARADFVVTVHLAFVLGVLAGLIAVLVGWLAGWAWTRNFWFRMAHLLAILIVAGQAVVRLECPLTTLEVHLRGGPGMLDELDKASAVGRFCNRTLYLRDVPFDYFKYIYGAVGGLVLLTWVLSPPRVPWAVEPAPVGV